MFKDLVTSILKLANETQTSASVKLGYKGQSAFQSAIINKDIKLTVLARICTLCGFQILITNNAGITFNITDIVAQNEKAKNG